MIIPDVRGIVDGKLVDYTKTSLIGNLLDSLDYSKLAADYVVNGGSPFYSGVTVGNGSYESSVFYVIDANTSEYLFAIEQGYFILGSTSAITGAVFINHQNSFTRDSSIYSAGTSVGSAYFNLSGVVYSGRCLFSSSSFSRFSIRTYKTDLVSGYLGLHSLSNIIPSTWVTGDTFSWQCMYIPD